MKKLLLILGMLSVLGAIPAQAAQISDTKVKLLKGAEAAFWLMWAAVSASMLCHEFTVSMWNVKMQGFRKAIKDPQTLLVPAFFFAGFGVSLCQLYKLYNQ